MYEITPRLSSGLWQWTLGVFLKLPSNNKWFSHNTPKENTVQSTECRTKENKNPLKFHQNSRRLSRCYFPFKKQTVKRLQFRNNEKLLAFNQSSRLRRNTTPTRPMKSNCSLSCPRGMFNNSESKHGHTYQRTCQLLYYSQRLCVHR